MRSWGAEGEEATTTEPVHAIEIEAPRGRGLAMARENLAGCRMRNADDAIFELWDHVYRRAARQAGELRGMVEGRDEAPNLTRSIHLHHRCS